MTTSWADALDIFEVNLGEAKKQLAGIVPNPQREWPPTDLVNTALPAELRERGQLLFDESERLQVDLAVLRDTVPTVSSPRRRARHPRTRPASHRVFRDL